MTYGKCIDCEYLTEMVDSVFNSRIPVKALYPDLIGDDAIVVCDRENMELRSRGLSIDGVMQHGYSLRQVISEQCGCERFKHAGGEE